MVGEISATDCAKSCGKPSASVRSGGPVDTAAGAPGSVVVFMLVNTFQVVELPVEFTMATPFEAITGPRSKVWKHD
jgi:hypothetical protein